MKQTCCLEGVVVEAKGSFIQLGWIICSIFSILRWRYQERSLEPKATQAASKAASAGSLARLLTRIQVYEGLITCVQAVASEVEVEYNSFQTTQGPEARI